ncbi:MAG: hypothetical protein LWX11_10350 [Firmicutes bacterium]|nr:hypothetical protein [Bacillota bacterium]
MRIGEKVDHLTAFIDQSLGGFRRTDPAHPKTPTPPTWFQELADDLAPAFRVED